MDMSSSRRSPKEYASRLGVERDNSPTTASFHGKTSGRQPPRSSWSWPSRRIRHRHPDEGGEAAYRRAAMSYSTTYGGKAIVTRGGSRAWLVTPVVNDSRAPGPPCRRTVGGRADHQFDSTAAVHFAGEVKGTSPAVIARRSPRTICFPSSAMGGAVQAVRDRVSGKARRSQADRRHHRHRTADRDIRRKWHLHREGTDRVSPFFVRCSCGTSRRYVSMRYGFQGRTTHVSRLRSSARAGRCVRLIGKTRRVMAGRIGGRDHTLAPRASQHEGVVERNEIPRPQATVEQGRRRF